MFSDRKPQIRQLAALREEITLVPFSGIQMLDFGFDIASLDMRPLRFIERVTGQQGEEDILTLFPLTGDDDRDAEVLDGRRDDDDEYSVRPAAALDPFLGQWVPAPFLRLKSQRGPAGELQYDPGPSSWARMRVVALAEPDAASGHTHRVQIALDTALIAQQQGAAYVAPEQADAEKSRDFKLASDPNDMRWFLRRPETDEAGSLLDHQRWVSDWLKELFLNFKRAERPGRRFSEDSLPHRFEHWARYLACLHLVDKACSPPRVRFANTVSERDAVTPVNVDLVLDVGNSRTCGILIEQFPDETRVDLARSYPLEIRDLSQPQFHYSGLFPSRVECADLRFGDDRYASRSGRRNAFAWPSFVRIGPEALRLVQSEEGTETVSGLSSPKRYLWDSAAVQQDWRFHNHMDPNNLPKAVRSAMRHLNEAGDVMNQVRYEEEQRLRKRGETPSTPAIRPRFSRSSLFGFMMAEIIAHALVQINDPASRARRAQSDLPRRLNRIILSLPTATPVKEQAIIRSRTLGALELIWQQLGLDSVPKPYSSKPQVMVDWDEASCTQLVYLYSELTQKFDGRIDTFLSLKGQSRPAPGGGEEPSLRLASIDVGGGTTDLMITTYRSEANRVLHPEQTFREGFRVAGDDLVHRVVSTIVIPRIQESIEAAGGSYVAEKLRELFGGDIGGQDQQAVQRRRQFSLRVLVPLAEAILAHCETSEEFDRFDLPVARILGLPDPADPEEAAEDESAADAAAAASAAAAAPDPAEQVSPDILSYVEDAAAALGAPEWKLAGLVLHSSREDVDAISREVFQRVLGNMCEVIDHLGVDVVLLTGRPSRLPAIRSIVEEMLVVPPHRLISMHQYKTGRWYPFRDPVTQKIGDPKSTVAVGGMLIALSENRIPNFKVTTGAFQMRSTARFVGEMDINGQILDQRVLFSGLDLDSNSPGDDTAVVSLYSPVYIGARQLPLERWTTTPLYRLDFASTGTQTRPLPIRVELRKTDFDDSDGDSSEDKLRRESMREAFEIDLVEDGEGGAMKTSEVVLKLHTLGFGDEYWIDTGVFQV